MSEYTHPIINNDIIMFHDKPDGVQYESEAHKFGVFFLEIGETEMTRNAQYIHSSNDMSGSMEENNKMQELHLTLKNIVNLLSKNAHDVDVTLEITGFDNKIQEVIMPTKIQKDQNQVDEIHKQIKHILQPRGSTDIELALKDATNKINIQTSANSKHLIFMTDGLITAGSTNFDVLTNEVCQDSRNYFVGFGADHDFHLLQHLASVNSGQYYYVDNIENAGLVFGEIIHSILYTAIENFTITVKGGEIYNFQTNTWTTELNIPFLCGEAKKQIHLRSENPNDFELSYSGLNVHTGEKIEDTQTELPHLEKDGILDIHDLSIYIYRQKTLELLSDVCKFCIERNEMDIDTVQKITNELKTKLQHLRKKLEEYKLECTNESDKDFIKQLCDDLFISEKTIHSEKALMYTTPRRTVQGCGGSHNITNIESCDFKNEEDYEIVNSPISIRCTSNTQEQIMRECSNRM